MLTLKIPYTFIERKLGNPSWRDILFGLENGLLDASAVPEKAAADVEQGDASADLIELVGVPAGAPVLADVRRLAGQEREGDEAGPRERWLYLVLAWLFEHRGALDDPLDEVETVYAEFDHPPEIAPFVRYMPSDDPDLGSQELNEARLVAKWERYLDDMNERLVS